MVDGKAGHLDVEPPAEGTNQEVILGLGAEFSGMGEAVDVELIVARAA